MLEKLEVSILRINKNKVQVTVTSINPENNKQLDKDTWQTDLNGIVESYSTPFFKDYIVDNFRKRQIERNGKSKRQEFLQRLKEPNGYKCTIEEVRT